MADKTLVPDAIVAESELAQLLHDWAVRWVDGHDEADRASCFSADLARAVVEGGVSEHSELLIRPRKATIVLVCSTCLKTWSEGHTCERGQEGRDGSAAVD